MRSDGGDHICLVSMVIHFVYLETFKFSLRAHNLVGWFITEILLAFFTSCQKLHPLEFCLLVNFGWVATAFIFFCCIIEIVWPFLPLVQRRPLEFYLFVISLFRVVVWLKREIFWPFSWLLAKAGYWNVFG